MGVSADYLEDPAVRAPLTYVPEVRRLVAGDLVEGPGYRVLRPHGTTDHLLILTRAGHGRLGMTAVPAGQAPPPQPEVSAGLGSVTLLFPGTPHDYGVPLRTAEGRTAADPHWDIAYCHFHPRPEWQVLLDWPQPAPGLGQLQLGATVASRVAQDLARAGYYTRSGQPRADLFGMNALESALLWCDTQNPRARRLDERLLRVLEHLDRHLAEPWTVAGLARVAGLSPSRFAHLFAEQVGVPPLVYLERQRLDQAKELLDLTLRPVREIARSVGYPDALYFSTRFRRRVGVSPTAYRARGRRSPTPPGGRPG